MSRVNKKVLITGGAGFIGSNFVYKFLDLGYKVIVLEVEGANLWRLDKIKKQIRVEFVNLKNYDRIEALIAELNPQIILHFATYGVSLSRQQDIKETVDTNLLGAINLVNACSKIKFECFINTGSNSEYGAKDKPMKEDDLLEPNNLYGVTKAAGTLYCQYVAKKLDLPIVSTRLFSPYGYFEEKDRFIPTVIRSYLRNSELNLSSPDSVRDFIFIEDIIDAYLAIIKNIAKVKGEIFNIGTGKQTPIAEVVDAVKKSVRSTMEPKYGQVKKAQLEPKNWLADIYKTKKMLNWQPKYNLAKGLEKDIEWFRKNLYLYN